MKYSFHTDGAIEALQIHSEMQAAAYLSRWDGALFSLRFEPVRLSSGDIALGLDCILYEAQRAELFTLLGALILDDGVVRFPRVFRYCRQPQRERLTETILDHLTRKPAPNEIFEFQVPELTITAKPFSQGRTVPGLCKYVTAIQHIRRYTFASARLKPGRVVDYACGTGYGACILAANPSVNAYNGVDIDSPALEFARAHNRTSKTDFCHMHYEEFRSLPFENVLSLEAIELARDPHRFMEHLIEKLAPEGQVILSVSTERWAGSHLNPTHITNWDYRRFHVLTSSFFERSTIFKQQLSLCTDFTFGRSIIYDRPPNTELDENFLAVLSGPKKYARRRIVVRRDHALGDTILATPLARSLKQQYPDDDIVFVTRHTQVFQSNPFVDIVATTQFEPAACDMIIDLNGAYETNRKVHVLEAYSKVAKQPLPHCRPELYPSPGHYRYIGHKILGRWSSSDIQRVLAIHPQASSPDRIWPIHRWQEFLSRVLADGRTGVILVGSGRDYDCEALELTSEPMVLSLVNQTDLLGTTAAIDLADVLVAPDSGLIHVASAMGTFTVGLFGMADPNTRVSLTYASLPIWSSIECRGCISDIPPEAPPLCKFGHSKCMEYIDASEVFSRYEQAVIARSPYAWLKKLNCVGFDLSIPDHPADSDSPVEHEGSENDSFVFARFFRRAAKGYR